jgi:amidophosphoribosyltransferase
MTRNNIFAFLDRFGFRPLWMGETDDFWVLASESCALDILRIARSRRQELKPGQIYHLSENGLRTYQFSGSVNPKRCIFELIYFARPDSIQWGLPVYQYRQRLGEMLAKYDKDLDFDVIMPVPDSANFIAYGYALAKNVPLQKFMPWALIRNHYVGRTFIKPDQKVRNESVRKKFNPLYEFFNKKRVVIFDDSIVRGTTIRKLVSMIFQAGARAVHLRIGCPPKKAPCYYGIATPTYEEHAWCKYGGLEGIKNYIEDGVRSYLEEGAIFTITYLKYDDLLDTVSKPDTFCMACFDGKYPIE